MEKETTEYMNDIRLSDGLTTQEGNTTDLFRETGFEQIRETLKFTTILGFHQQNVENIH